MNNSIGCKKYSDKVGVLLGQLGTPDSPDTRSLRRYLKQFLSDRRVIEVNPVLWSIILNGIILRTRPKRSAALYKRVWTSEGSPLLLISKRQAEGVQQYLSKKYAGVEVAFGMRYGNPSIESAVDKLLALGCSKIVFLPMYPQYAAATTASSLDALLPHLLRRRWVPSLHIIEPYYRNPDYLKALAHIINEALLKLPAPPEKVILSYHGVPKAYVEKGDPYCCMCTETTYALKPLINHPADDILHSFQSRFGKEPWLTPYTDELVSKLAHDGIKRVAVAAPGFTADCLETIDELGHELKDQFLEEGGEDLHLIPCLNDHPLWIEGMGRIVESEAGSWLSSSCGASGCIKCPMDTSER